MILDTLVPDATVNKRDERVIDEKELKRNVLSLFDVCRARGGTDCWKKYESRWRGGEDETEKSSFVCGGRFVSSVHSDNKKRRA
jgi:hypothetical protein